MRSKKIIIGILGLVLFLQGCSTCKGAAEGFKEDIQALGKADEWMRENLW